MNYNFFPSLLVRTPLYSFQEYKAVNCACLLKRKEFKAALFLASKEFFDELEKKQFEFELLNEKQKHTIRKYINRAFFRSTPFGLFSAFSLIKWTDQPETKIILPFETILFVKLDFPILVNACEKFQENQTVEFVKFRPNQSLYFSDMDLRYIKTDTDKNGQAHFSMVSVTKNSILKKLLRFCMPGKNSEEIRSFLLKEINADKKIVDDFIKELSDQQIIISNNKPNITGEDYSDLFFQYLIKEFGCTEVNGIWKTLRGLSKNSFGKLYQLPTVAQNLYKYLSLDNTTNLFYSIAERGSDCGGLPLKYQQQIKEGLHCLDLLCKTPSIPDLDKFKRAFETKYEVGEIPLLQVLDAQFGIGYGEFANIKNTYSFLNESYISSEKSYTTDNDQGKDLASLLLNEWHFNNNQDQGYEIEITDNHLKKIKAEEKNGKLPPSISVMFRVLDKDIFIEQAGGCSALSLIGRFSCSKKVHEFAKEIAAQEQNSNGNVLFAEVAHICNLHSANINRRNHLRDYEIPVLANSIIDQDKQIQLSDIMVSVINDTVILRSKKFRETIIPRLSSAYNYTKNFFPVFRFLYDVQRQHLKTDFSFSFSLLVPGLKFYPRVRYKSCLLQMAEWHFNIEELDFLRNEKIHKALNLFKDFAKLNNLPRHFAYSLYDNFLVFDLHNDDDLTFFLKEIKNKSTVVLKEFPFIEDDSIVKDTCHLPLLGQYVAALYLTEEVYKEETYKISKKDFALAKNTDDWLYFKIYCHPLSSDIILCNYFFPLIKKFAKDGTLKEWFWVRYQDPEYHIRLRIKAAQNKFGNVFEIFNAYLNKLCSVKLVHYFQTDIYKREIKRYSIELIQDVESVFNSSSNLICNFLKIKTALQWNDEKLLIEAVLSAHQMLLYVNFSLARRIEFCKIQFDQFFHEFGNPKNLKSEIEKLHKILYSEICSKFIDQKNKTIYKFLQKDFLNLLQHFKNKKIKEVKIENLTADMIHMHINRLFKYNQRYFEMVMYYLLYRSLATEMHKNHSIYP